MKIPSRENYDKKSAFADMILEMIDLAIELQESNL